MLQRNKNNINNQVRFDVEVSNESYLQPYEPGVSLSVFASCGY